MRKRSKALWRRYGRANGTHSWAGTGNIDRRFYDIQPGLAMTALGSGPLDAADDRMIAKGRDFVAWLEPQRAPRGTQFYKEKMLGDIRRLLAKAEAR